MSQYDDDLDRECDWSDKEDEWVEIDVDKIVSETELAICIRIDLKYIWIPKSQCDDWPDVDEAGIVRMKQWIAEEKDLV